MIGSGKTLVAVEFISVVPEMVSFGMLLVELYWSFDINTWVNAPQNFEAHSKATCWSKPGKVWHVRKKKWVEEQNGDHERRNREEVSPRFITWCR